MGSPIDRLSENAKSEKFDIDTKGLMTLKSAKMSILGQPVEINVKNKTDFSYKMIPLLID